MAIETFNWPVQTATQPTLDVKDRIRKAQFGDGYEQSNGRWVEPLAIFLSLFFYWESSASDGNLQLPFSS